MSPMYPTLERLYSQGKLTEAHLNTAVVKKWISETEKQQILS